MLPDDLELERIHVRLDDLPEELPILPVSEAVIYPQMIVPLVISDQKLIQLAEDVVAGSKLLGAFTQRPLDDTETEGGEGQEAEGLYRVGTVVAVHKTLRFPDSSMRLLGKGLCRIEILDWAKREPYLRARVRRCCETSGRRRRLPALQKSVRSAFVRVVEASENLPDELRSLALRCDDPGKLADLVSANVDFAVSEKQDLLETYDPALRLEKLVKLLAEQMQMLKLGEKLRTDIREEMDRDQREYYLRQQMKAIRKELGDGEDRASETDELRVRIEAAGLPQAAHEVAVKELERLARMSPASPEYTVAKSYIDCILELPWNASTVDHLDLRRAARILEEDHYDLQKVKERILEFLAVKKLNRNMQGPILCLAGPPGVGKTSLGRSIARSLGRQFVRVSLGGVRDEAEIRGHRRTYVGALPGRILQGLKTAGSNNPVFVLDEIDKLGADFRGDPSAALLEVLDPAQNDSFSDHYLSVPFDLSRILFIATANLIEEVPPVLRDRLEIIDIPGYTNCEKLEIAKRYLVRRQMKANGITPAHLRCTDAGLMSIISGYTREAGVRQLERCIGTLCRRVAKGVAAGRRQRRRLHKDNVAAYLGRPEYLSQEALRRGEVGVATGMAWTQAGGELLFIEAVKMPGGGGLKLTGSLGPIMRESAEAALSFLRARGPREGVAADFFDTHDFHIHVPAGATPKDGPSAGIAITTALASLVYGTPVRSDLAMSGEVTLTGKVLPVGGVRQKVLAAFRAGIRAVVLPVKNRNDLDEVPAEVMARLRFQFVESVEQVLDLALERRARPGPGGRLLTPAARTRARERRAAARRVAVRS